MKIYYVNYDKDTGEIISAGSGAAMHLDSVKNNQYGYLEVEGDHRLHYVNLETEELRDKIPFDLTVNGMTISGIPVGTSVRVEDDFYIVDDGVLEVTSDIPETIRIILKHVNYLKEVLSIEST